MSHQPNISEVRLINMIDCLKCAVALLHDLHDGFGTPFVLAISSTTESLMTTLQCIQLMGNIHGLIYAIVDLHLKSEPVGTVPPAMLGNIGKFTITLHKIHTFIQAQQDGNKFKYFFRQGEMNNLLKDCHTELQLALKVFKIETKATVWDSMKKMRAQTENMHKELLEVISTLSDGTISDRAPSPKIFHGRETELTKIVNIIGQNTARIAILGGGGMGKTTLAKAALHHPDVATNYQNRFFVACDSATTSADVAVLIGTYIGLKPGQNLAKPIVQFFSQITRSLLILDNLETAWEPKNSRHLVEQFLALLTDVPHLALIITMRGAERPANVHWTHPFLPPLEPLTDQAAHQTFIDIADSAHNSRETTQPLQLTDNMPLAIHLMAHLVDYEGSTNVLSRWETEKTSLLSNGLDKTSSLHISINVSLSSPRMISSPGAMDLLSLLSILPDGLSDIELLQSKLPIPDILRCKATLLGTSLAYHDDTKRLKLLVPIQEHIQNLSLIARATSHLKHLKNPDLESKFYLAMARYHYYDSSDHGTNSTVLFCEKALQLAKLNGNTKQTIEALTDLSEMMQQSGDRSAAKTFAREAVGLAALSGNLYLEAKGLWLNGVCYVYTGQYNNALWHFHRARELLALCGMSGGYLDQSITISEGEVYLMKSEYIEAHKIHTQIVRAAANEGGNTYAFSLLNICMIDVILGVAEDSVHRNMQKVKKIYNDMGYARGLGYCEIILGDLALRQNNLLKARTLFQKCLWTFWGNTTEAVSHCLEKLADPGNWHHNVGWVHQWPVIYFTHSLQKNETLAIHKALLFLGDIFLMNGDEATAHRAEQTVCVIWQKWPSNKEIRKWQLSSGKQQGHCLSDHHKQNILLKLTFNLQTFTRENIDQLQGESLEKQMAGM
ncbi:hypothetical protein DFH08DRAFT_806959 [Mycena albidolilacea]|uniref:NB-ARC domain-containing protein n=1 Tax=Mycena albidolilacea TaxID=1033008 RepID=A0AAD7A4W1_9AGAR|nr:hypothetical protein DFH08DRAFT_806959 [Mycena albidolilacea]